MCFTHARNNVFDLYFLLIGFYRLLLKFVSKEIALITNVLICFSPLLYYYCINPLPDILALVRCLVFGIFSLIYKIKKTLHFLLFSFFLMLAALVKKLPFILFGGVFILYAYKELIKQNIKEVLSKGFVLILVMIPVFAWYIKAVPTWKGNGLLQV